MTFINGPRMCIGKQYSMTELKLLLIEVLSQVRFGITKELADKAPSLTNPAVVLRPLGVSNSASRRSDKVDQLLFLFSHSLTLSYFARWKAGNFSGGVLPDGILAGDITELDRIDLSRG